MQRTEIPFNKAMLAFLVAIMLLLVFVSFKVGNVLLFFIPIWILCAVYFGSKLLTDKPAVIIDSQGILSNTGYKDDMLIAWKDVTHISVHEQQIKFRKAYYVIIKVNDPEKYLSEFSGWKKYMVKLNMSTYGTPFILNPGIIDADFDELYALLKKRHEEYKKLNEL